MHYIKFFQTLALASTYKEQIKENIPNHPIDTINTFIMISMLYAGYYQYSNYLNTKEDMDLINYCGIYVFMDLLLILISVFMIGKVKAKASDLIDNKRFKEYTTEAEIAT